MNVKGLPFVFLIVSSVELIAQEHQFTREEMIHDLEFLKKELIINHPNLYTYSTEEEVGNWFESEIQNIANSVDERQAFRIVSSISSVLKDGHSYIYPSAKHLDDFFNVAPLFPLDVFLMNENFIVVGNFSDEQNIPLGAKLVQINGVDVKDIQSEVVSHTCRDGNNLAYPKYLYYQFFPAYYSYFYGFQKEFEIVFSNRQGELEEVMIQGVTREQVKTKRNSDIGKGIDLQLMKDQEAALLTIKSFDSKILKNDFSQKFKKEISRVFQVIEEQDIRYLAIDLRDNQGGYLSNGTYLLQHFMDTAFQCVYSYGVLKNGREKTLNTKWDNFFKPRVQYHFDGDVYLFTNGGSFSCSAIVANTFKESKRGTVLGQMSGGSAFVNSGGPNKMISLPSTKIIFTIPKTQYNLRGNMTSIGLGVVPDITLQDDPSRLIDGVDRYLERFIELIKN